MLLNMVCFMFFSESGAKGGLPDTEEELTHPVSYREKSAPRPPGSRPWRVFVRGCSPDVIWEKGRLSKRWTYGLKTNNNLTSRHLDRNPQRQEPT